MYGRIGFAIGIVAVLLAVIAQHAHVNFDPDDWFLLDWVAGGHAGELVTSTPWVAKSVGILSITERNVIVWTYVVAGVLSAAAAALAVFGEAKNENSFFSANALLFGAGALVLINQALGYSMLIMVFALLMYIRWKGATLRQAHAGSHEFEG